MDLLEDDAPRDGPGGNEPEYTVSEISGAIKRTLEGEFGRVRIKGECGRVMVARSGHVYLDLKDDRAVISSVIWKGQAARLAVKPEEGMEVVAIGKLTTFAGQSRYQLVIEDIRPAGVGALMAMLEKRKAMLQAEGLFAPERKRPLPFLPDVIGVVTSPQGAVIRDILHRLRDRFPRKVLIWPVVVQGDACAPQVTAAINGFNALTPGGAVPRPDLIIVARGGGSLEDLWGFNEENVARAAAGSEIPLISAVGHETDTTLIDFVSDQRAPTPTAAAEMAVPVRLELLAGLENSGGRLARSAADMITRRQQRLRDLSRALPQRDALTNAAAQRLDAVGGRLSAGLRSATQAKWVMLERQAAPLRPSLLRRKTEQMSARLTEAGRRLDQALGLFRERSRTRFDGLSVRLKPALLGGELKRECERYARETRRLSQVARRQMDDQQGKLDRLERLRKTLGYQATLERGYAVVREGETRVITTVGGAKSAGTLTIQFKDGLFSPGDPDPNLRAPARKMPTKKPAQPTGDGNQGSLFDEDG